MCVILRRKLLRRTVSFPVLPTLRSISVETLTITHLWCHMQSEGKFAHDLRGVSKMLHRICLEMFTV